MISLLKLIHNVKTQPSSYVQVVSHGHMTQYQIIFIKSSPSDIQLDICCCSRLGTTGVSNFFCHVVHGAQQPLLPARRSRRSLLVLRPPQNRRSVDYPSVPTSGGGSGPLASPGVRRSTFSLRNLFLI